MTLDDLIAQRARAIASATRFDHELYVYREGGTSAPAELCTAASNARVSLMVIEADIARAREKARKALAEAERLERAPEIGARR